MIKINKWIINHLVYNVSGLEWPHAFNATMTQIVSTVSLLASFAYKLTFRISLKLECQYIYAMILLRLLYGFLTLPLVYQVSFTLADNSETLKGKSFSLRTSVSILFRNGDRYVNRIHESYSAEQKRAKLNFQQIKSAAMKKNSLDGQPEQGTIYYEPKTESFLLFDTSSLICKPTSMEELEKIIRLEVPDDDLDLIGREHIIGPARLLFFLDKHENKMKLDFSPNTRNMDSQMYSFDYQTKYDKIKFKVIYSSESLAVHGKTIPIMVVMLFPDRKDDQVALVIDFFSFEIIRTDEPEVYTNQVIYDPFIIEPATSCSQVLADKAIDLFKDKQQDTARFSFRADFDINKYMMTSYVAYDARLDILRYDLLVEDGRSGVRRQLYNVRQNKMYHAMEKRMGSETLVDKVLDLGLKGDETRQCMVAKIMHVMSDKNSKPFTLGKLLVGSDKFVYLGKARVRGLDVKVYETNDGGFPFWFEQPVVYKADKNSYEQQRNPEIGLLKSAENIKYTVLLYFAEREENHPLVLIELYKMDKAKSVTWAKQSIQINDFVWDLDLEQSEGGVRDLFSLQEHCSSDSGLKYYAKAELLLESDNLDSETALSSTNVANSNIRYLALLSAIQNTFNLPAPMIYDLESKILTPHKTNSQKANKLLMAVSFRISEQVDNLIELIYIGQGGQRRLYKGDKVVTVTRSFQACFFIAAHRRANIYFAYNPNTKSCVIILDPILSAEVDDSNQDCFNLGPKEKLEVYRINHKQDKESNYWIKKMYHSRSKLDYLGSKMKLDDLSDNNERKFMDFIVKRFDVDERDYKMSISTGDKNSKNNLQVQTDKIVGYGLIASEELRNKRVAPAALNSYNWSPLSEDLKDKRSVMTLQQCEAACVADLDCQSYSICVKDRELQCIISRTSFRSPDVIKQLEEKGKNAKRGDKISVVLDGVAQTKSELVKNSACELYNMIFLNLFYNPILVMNTFTNRRIYPVKDQEECAKLCLKQNIQVWREDVSGLAKSVVNLAEKNDQGNDFMVKMLDRHRRATQQISTGFHYLDRARLSTLSKVVAEKVQDRILEEDKMDIDSIEGYCIVGERLKDREKKALEEHDKYDESEVKEYINLSMYTLKFNLFYEKQHGVHLLASPKSNEQAQAYRLVHRKDPDVTEGDYTTLRRMLEANDNFQETLYADETKCALICFIQSWGPWPACRSFDVIIEFKLGEYVSRCSLNSITLQQAISTNRLDLINDNTNENVLQVMHFEPRPGLALDEANLNKYLSVLEERSLNQSAGSKLGYRVGGWGIFFILLLAFVGGTVFGVKVLGWKLHQKISERLGGMENRDRDELVRRTSKIEFNNIVNDEGAIRQ